ncbi:MAG: hypothetical protein IPF41_11165 [Flavobacteriales bacterium]|nr:hypothetical protein [Flavobacteriales bacterium]
MNLNLVLKGALHASALAGLLLAQSGAHAQSTAVDIETTVAPVAKPDLPPANAKQSKSEVKTTAAVPSPQAGEGVVIGKSAGTQTAGTPMKTARRSSPHQMDPEDAPFQTREP